MERAWQSGRMPHALLLEGPSGLGKLPFAWRVAGLVLGLPDNGAPDGDQVPAHADIQFVTLEQDNSGKEKKQIGVEQIRQLCSKLAMTSHSGGYKVAVICPAEAMNANAANSLLKTLEEPTPSTLLILVRSRLDTLPATIASRCQRIRFAVPGHDMAKDWLSSRQEGQEWDRLLDIAGGAPLRALALASGGLAEKDRQFRQDLCDLVEGRGDPVEIAARWQKEGLGDCLAWLNCLVCDLIRHRAGGCLDLPDDLQNLSETLRLERLFWYLDEVQAMVRRSAFALTPQLVLESLLIPWTGRLDRTEPGAFT